MLLDGDTEVDSDSAKVVDALGDEMFEKLAEGVRE